MRNNYKYCFVKFNTENKKRYLLVKMSKYRFFAFCPVNESNAHPLGQDLEKYISPNVDPGHSGTCASKLVTSAYGCKPCSAERFLSDLIA